MRATSEKKMTKNKRCAWQRERAVRSGATVVEFAFVAPVLFLLVFSAIEFARVNMIKHTVENAAYEAARRGIVPGATSDNVLAVADSFLATASIKGATVDISPAAIAPSTEELTVSITVSLDSNGWITPLYFNGKTVSASCTLKREKYGTLF